MIKITSMKKTILSIFCLVALVVAFTSCNDYETYADKKKKENAAISQFLTRDTNVAKKLMSKPINVISESEFEKAGNVTDTAKNQYVLFESTGVYMQIVNKGCGEEIKSGETTVVLCRFNEYNVLGDSLQFSNVHPAFYNLNPDKMTIMRNEGTYTGVFNSTAESMMAYAYNSTSVPSGWLMPLRYIKIGRPSSEGESIAKVRLLVPSDQGHSDASSKTYPCFYELSYQRGI